MTNNTGITYSSSSASSAINIYNCFGNLGTTGIGIYTNTSTGTLAINRTTISNTGASLTASTTSAGNVQHYFCNYNSAFSTSSAALMSIFNCVIDTSANNLTILTTAGTGGATISHCYFATGTASTLSAGAGTTINATLCTVNSTNTNAITGAGTAVLTNINFTGSSHQTNVTTQTGGAVSGLTQGTAPSAGMLGEQIRGFQGSGSLSNNSASSVISINLTNGVWDISLNANFSFSGISTAIVAGIGTTNNSFTGITNGDNGGQFSYASVSGGEYTISVPSYRAVVTGGTTTYYGVGLTLFSTGACTAAFRISATRVG
jgi:hypothetical protein